MKKTLVAGVAGLAIIVFTAGMSVGVYLDRHVSPIVAVPRDSAPEFRLFSEAWTTTRHVYVDHGALDTKHLMYGALDGMVNSLQDTGHSRFLTPEMVRLENNYQMGQIEGVGVEVQQKDGHVVIVTPIEGSPAQAAGLRSGDIILDVNGQPVSDIADAVRRILGPAGTSVTLTILSPPGTTKDVTLVRAKITIRSVTWHMIPGSTVAHVRLASFASGTASQLKDALTAIDKQDATGLILDLRNNPGGLLDEAINVTGVFLKSGNALIEKDTSGKKKPVPVNPASTVTDLPTVVIINGGTASAAEIVAGALQDAGRAKLVGETTFGTGTVLQKFPLPDGSALLLAVQEWLTPSGKTIWRKGLAPDLDVSLAQNAVPVYPTAEENMTAEQFRSGSDQQLLKALSLLAAS